MSDVIRVAVPSIAAADRQRVEGFMANHWLHKAALPAAHAYKHASPITVLASY